MFSRSRLIVPNREPAPFLVLQFVRQNLTNCVVSVTARPLGYIIIPKAIEIDRYEPNHAFRLM